MKYLKNVKINKSIHYTFFILKNYNYKKNNLNDEILKQE